ncbi:MAG: helix-turn-helix domain-containing protein [Chloroflexi bacterium]|nr:helix-turn-helix domain-containing protein [Chloroflexota bacterium]
MNHRVMMAEAHNDAPTSSPGETADAASTHAPRRPSRHIAKPDDLAAAIRKVMASRGLTTREVVRRVPRRHVGTVYRLLAGRTTDPWASTIVSLCTALDADPDELLGVEDAVAGLDPELRQTLADVETLDEEDRWLALDMLRSVLARRYHGKSGPGHLTSATAESSAEG